MGVNGLMTASEKCYQIVQASEGCILAAYLCPRGIPTIGYGHTHGVALGMTCSPVQASAWLAEDLHNAEQAVHKYVKVPLSQDEFDALCSFVFNLGASSLVGTTLISLLNAGYYPAAATEMLKWCHVGKKVEPGLVIRRKRESALFSGNPDFMEA